MAECVHAITQGRDGQKGSWCVACGIKVLEVHDRPCAECRHSEMNWRPPVCRHHLMVITRDMHVTYFIGRPAGKGGLCFEGKA